jgi:hypothetical protein
MTHVLAHRLDAGASGQSETGMVPGVVYANRGENPMNANRQSIFRDSKLLVGAMHRRPCSDEFANLGV